MTKRIGETINGGGVDHRLKTGRTAAAIEAELIAGFGPGYVLSTIERLSVDSLVALRFQVAELKTRAANGWPADAETTLRITQAASNEARMVEVMQCAARATEAA